MRRLRLLVLVAFLSTSACATYSERIERAAVLTEQGQYTLAMDELNRVLGVDSSDELPDKWGSEKPLAVLERGALHQATEQFRSSSRDLSAGELEIELLDYKHDTEGQIGKYVYSDSAQDYEAPPTERLALNAVNLLNYLSLSDWQGAAVEARRFTVMREYLASTGLDRQGTFGSYLAGLTFEKLGEGSRALRYYEEAMENGPLQSLREPVARLAAINSYRGPNIESLLASGANSSKRRPSEIVVVMAVGRVPYKVPKRIPVGVAIGIAGTYITGNPEVLARAATKVIVYPELTESGSRLQDAAVTIAGRGATVDRISSLGADIRREYDRLRGPIIGAALTRMIARALVAEGVRQAGRQQSDALGILAALATEAALVGLDKPDTRSWNFLADHVLVARRVVKPGEHRVDVVLSGGGLRVERSRTVSVGTGETVVVVVTEPR